MFGLGINKLGSSRSQASATPETLFYAGEEGTFLDFTTSQVYADTAGTDPAEVGEGIALTLDKSQGANDVRRNLLRYTEEFDNAVWLKSNVTVLANTVVAPAGTTTADTLTQSVVSGLIVHVVQLCTIALNTPYDYSVFIKQNDCEDFIKILLGAGNQSAGFGLSLDPSDMSVNYATAEGTGFTYTSHSVTPVGDGWHRVSVRGTSSVTSALAAYIGFNDTAVGSHAADRTTNGGTGSVYIWGAQLEVAE